MAQSSWLSQRALRFQTECFFPDGSVDEKRLALFLRYQTTHDRAFHKSLATLTKLQKERVVGFVSQPVPVPALDARFVSQLCSKGVPQALDMPGFVSQNSVPCQLATSCAPVDTVNAFER